MTDTENKQIEHQNGTQGAQQAAAPKKRKHPVIDEKECAGCSVCVENCPMNCLRIGPPKFHGDIHTTAQLAHPERCTGCGICAKVCPIWAIEMKEGD